MAMNKKKDRGSGGVFSDINITPLTDIFLVLLIIFMVTTAVTIESAAHVDLPKAEQPQPQTDKPKGVIVTYTADHQIMVGDKQVTEPELQTTLAQQLAPLQSSDKIVITGSTSLPALRGRMQKKPEPMSPSPRTLGSTSMQ